MISALQPHLKFTNDNYQQMSRVATSKVRANYYLFYGKDGKLIFIHRWQLYGNFMHILINSMKDINIFLTFILWQRRLLFYSLTGKMPTCPENRHIKCSRIFFFKKRRKKICNTKSRQTKNCSEASFLYLAQSKENLILLQANMKGSNHPAHQHSLIFFL